MSSGEESPPIHYTFELKVKPLRKLRVAMEALVDPVFNEFGVGMVSVDEEGFKFMARNANKDVACLRIHSSGTNIISFRSYQPMTGNFVPLGFISDNFPVLDLDGDNDSVSISHVRGSAELWFKFDIFPPTEFSVEFFVTSKPEAIPFANVFCGTALLTKDVRQMIDYMLQADSSTEKAVLVEMKQNMATFTSGTRHWEYDYNRSEMAETKGLEHGHTQQAMFEWTYPTILYKASFLQVQCMLYFVSDPLGHIMFLFSMPELGDLVITHAAVSMFPEIQQRTEEEKHRDTFSF